MLLADVITDPTTPWLSLILQGGAFTLIVYIVCRLYPAEAKAAREERYSRDKVMTDLIERLQAKFEERNERLIESIDKQTVRLERTFERVCNYNFYSHPHGPQDMTAK